MAEIEHHEGVALKAYRDPVGVLTIGAGLTSASGVVRVTPGMTISRAEASRLLALALAQNYEPAVRRAMPASKQQEFDAGVGFHYNTGAISRASWVNAWRRKDWPDVHRRLLMWTKGGGKVLPGLERRREAEFRLMREGIYASAAPQPTTRRRPAWARITLAVSADELAAIRAGLRKLGYEPGPDAAGIDIAAVIKFQREHDLTPDGVVGRATLSTLQRRLDARAKATVPAATGAAGAGAEAAPPDLTGLPDWAGTALLAVAVLAALWLAFRYRDVVAAKIAGLAPRAAAFLRRF